MIFLYTLLILQILQDHVLRTQYALKEVSLKISLWLTATNYLITTKSHKQQNKKINGKIITKVSFSSSGLNRLQLGKNVLRMLRKYPENPFKKTKIFEKNSVQNLRENVLKNTKLNARVCKIKLIFPNQFPVLLFFVWRVIFWAWLKFGHCLRTKVFSESVSSFLFLIDTLSWCPVHSHILFSDTLSTLDSVNCPVFLQRF